MRTFRKNRKIIKASNAIDPATSSLCWGKKANKHYLGVAGKGGATTNFNIPEKEGNGDA